MSLIVQDLLRHYGGVKALDGVSFEVPSGQCVALIGPNGAGKSTCFACLAGQQTPGSGRVVWRGQDVTGLQPAQRVARGVDDWPHRTTVGQRTGRVWSASGRRVARGGAPQVLC